MARTETNWIQTASGRRFWPTDPRSEDVCIEDIGHALAMKCRFSGHTKSFYSVAQHSLLVSENVSPEYAKVALLHDAAEAYFADVAKPIKREYPVFDEIEGMILLAVFQRFDLHLPLPDVVKRIDMVLLATERRDLMAHPRLECNILEGVVPLREVIRPLCVSEANALFMARAAELGLR